MNNLTPVEHKNQRVLTTQQLAEAYETDTRRISENFTRNYERYQVGKHYYLLEGEEKREFCNHTQIADGSLNASKLYLWTEKGAWLHAKSLNTDSAWEAYEMLVDSYYEMRLLALDVSMLSPELQMFQQLFNSIAKQELRVKQLEETTQVIKDTFVDTDENWLQWVGTSLNKVAVSENFTALINKYQAARQESYTKLETRAGCKLGIRVGKAIDRAKETGATMKHLDSITKLHVIHEDKRLKEIYTTIVKEMLLAYAA